jgi:hypothetical protein
MKRLGRYILNALTVLSLLLAITTAGLWVRSAFVEQFVSFEYSQKSGNEAVVQTANVGVSCGTFAISHEIASLSAEEVQHFFKQEVRAAFLRDEPILEWNSRSASISVQNLSYLQRVFGEHETFRLLSDAASNLVQIDFPLWLPLVIFLALPIIRAPGLWRKQRFRPGHCPTCGYDMRANPAKCSECGHEPVTT